MATHLRINFLLINIITISALTSLISCKSRQDSSLSEQQVILTKQQLSYYIKSFELNKTHYFLYPSYQYSAEQYQNAFWHSTLSKLPQQEDLNKMLFEFFQKDSLKQLWDKNAPLINVEKDLKYTYYLTADFFEESTTSIGISSDNEQQKNKQPQRLGTIKWKLETECAPVATKTLLLLAAAPLRNPNAPSKNNNSSNNNESIQPDHQTKTSVLDRTLLNFVNYTSNPALLYLGAREPFLAVSVLDNLPQLPEQARIKSGDLFAVQENYFRQIEDQSKFKESSLITSYLSAVHFGIFSNKAQMDLTPKNKIAQFKLATCVDGCALADKLYDLYNGQNSFEIKDVFVTHFQVSRHEERPLFLEANKLNLPQINNHQCVYPQAQEQEHGD